MAEREAGVFQGNEGHDENLPGSRPGLPLRLGLRGSAEVGACVA